MGFKKSLQKLLHIYISGLTCVVSLPLERRRLCQVFLARLVTIIQVIHFSSNHYICDILVRTTDSSNSNRYVLLSVILPTSLFNLYFNQNILRQQVYYQK